jgi:hypothetical protein
MTPTGYEYHRNVVLGCQQFALIGERAGLVMKLDAADGNSKQPSGSTSRTVDPGFNSCLLPLLA